MRNGLVSVRFRAAAAAVALLAVAGVARSGAAAEAPVIHVLSNRADLVSAGDALVAVDLNGNAPSSIALDVDGRDVTGDFAVRENGRFEGLVTGLADGPNVLTAALSGGGGARITITSHPNGGPVFSGPLVQPWVCAAGALDASCNRTTTYAYFYVPAAGAVGTNVAGFSIGAGFQSYDPDNPPAPETIGTTTTDQGVTVPYIIRVETGNQDRDQYKIAVLFTPGEAWAPWKPQPAWNHKLLITHGASCGVDHTEGSAPDVQNDPALSRGFAVMSTALDNAGHNCNVITEAESLVMAKEHLVETYGEIRYTIGTGCSGGSLVQHQVANAYPGVYEGLLPQCSFPDAWSTGLMLEDLALVRGYLEDPSKWSPGVVWDPRSIGAIDGHPNHANSVIFTQLYTAIFKPTTACAGVTAAQRYEPATNPGGVRCTGQDYMINVFGKRASDGFAGRPLDNVGVQYGLNALMNGTITPAQFADLNAKTGSHDIDYNWQPGRVAADEPALQNDYRSGAINTAHNLKNVAIIDLRGTDPGAFHDVFRAFAVRSRLERSNGTHENQVIWEGPVPLLGQADYTTLGLIAMDRWLANVEADHRTVPVSQKVIEDRPADVHDQCTDGLGHAIPDERTCHTINPFWSTPRIQAGEPFTDDVVKCRLRPLQRHDYFPVEFTDAEWAQARSAFPSGVCDYSQPGVGQQATIPWMTYQDASGNVITGGTPLGPVPESAAF